MPVESLSILEALRQYCDDAVVIEHINHSAQCECAGCHMVQRLTAGAFMAGIRAAAAQTEATSLRQMGVTIQ